MLKNVLANHFPPGTSRKDKIFITFNLLIPVLIGMYIFVNPLPVAAIGEMCFYLSCALLITLLVFRKIDFTLRTPMTLPFALFVLWAVFGLFFALDLKNSVHDLRGHLLEHLVVFYVLVNFFSTRNKLEILSMILIAGATVFSIGGIIAFYIIEGFPLSERLGLTFKDMYINYSGFITIFAAVLAVRHFYEHKKILYKALFGFCFLMNVAATLLTQSRGALIGLAAALMILCITNKKNMIVMLVFIVMMVSVPGIRTRLQTEGFTEALRVQIYRLTYEVIKDHPVVGVGFGMEIFSNKDLVPLEDYNRKLPPPYRQQGVIINSPHNLFLDVAVRTGVVGLILFMVILFAGIGMLWIIFKRNKKDEYFRSWVIYLSAGFISFLMQSLFADSTFGPRVVLFYTALAMITILWNLSRKSRTGVLNA